MTIPHRLRIVLRCVLWSIALLLLVIVACNAFILWRARDLTCQSVADLPVQEVGIVLGTSPSVGQWKNRFFEGRMEAAAQLFHAGKVRHLLLSGDNGTRGYDEPTAMKAALLARGVPESALHLDYAGFRTLDTMARAHEVFGVRKATLITDDFHLPRSLFLAQEQGIEAIGFAATPIPFRHSAKTLAREACSRVAALLDVYVLHTQPRFLGAKVEMLAAER